MDFRKRITLPAAALGGMFVRSHLPQSVTLSLEEVKKAATLFVLDRQDEEGGIGGFYVSSWSLMALNKLEPQFYSEIPALERARERLADYLRQRGYVFLENNLEEQLARLSQATEGLRIILSLSSTEMGEALFQAVWEKSERIANTRRQRGDPYPVWRAFMLMIMERYGLDEKALKTLLTLDLWKLQKSDGGWSDEVGDISYIDHTAAVMVALNAPDPNFFEGRRDQDTGGFRGPGEHSSVESTSWALMALGTDPQAAAYLANQQQEDGSISTFRTRAQAKIWPTVLALSALLGQGF